MGRLTETGGAGLKQDCILMFLFDPAMAYRNAYGGLSREVWFLSAALLINRCGSMVLGFLTLYLTSKLNFSIVQAGVIFSIYGLGSVAGSWISGKLIRHVGAIRLQIVALGISCPCFLIVPLFESFAPVAASIFTLSLFSESVRPANNVAIMQFTEPELQTRAFGLQRMALNLGLSIGPATGGILATYNFDWLFWVDGVTTLLGSLLLWRLFGFRKYSRPRAGRPDRQQETLAGVGSPWHDSRFLIFLGLLFCVALIFFQFHATYPKFLEDHFRLSKPQIGFLYAVNTALIVAVEMLLVNFVRRFPMLVTIGWGGVFACLGFAMLPFSDSGSYVVLSMLVITLGEMLMFPIATGYVARRSSGRDAGMYMSWYAMTYSVTAIVAPLVGTGLYSLDPNAIWYLAFALAAVVGAGFSRLRAAEIRNPHDLPAATPADTADPKDEQDLAPGEG